MLLGRYFEYAGYDIKFVSNFTDVDDEIIKASNEEKYQQKNCQINIYKPFMKIMML